MMYRFMNFNIGSVSHDWFTFVLFRTRQDIKIRRHPNTIGISTAILLDLIEHKTRIIIVKINDIPTFRTDPETWLKNGIIDKLSPNQDPHAFLSIDKFQKIGKTFELLDLGSRNQDQGIPLTNFLEDNENAKPGIV